MRRRIIVCLGILLTLCLLGNAIAMLCLDSSIRNLTALAASHEIQSMRADLISNGVRIESDLLAYRTGDRHDLKQTTDRIRRFEQSIRQCSGCHHATPIRARLREMTETFDVYQKEAFKLYGQANQPDTRAQEKTVQTLIDRLISQATTMSDEARHHLFIRNADAIAGVRRAWFALCGAFVVALVVGGIVAFHLMGRLTRPVQAMLAGIERVQQGDLGHRFAIDADEEFRTLAAAFEHAYTSLRNAQESVIHAEKMAFVGKLAAGIAHEVGNPLASISSIAQLMRRKAGSEEETRQLDLIMEQITRISRIVRDLLSFSRPKAAAIRNPVQIDGLLRQAVTLLGYDRRAQNIEVVPQFDGDLCLASGDHDKLLLVFTNVLINAFDAIGSKDEGHAGLVNIRARRDGDDIIVQFEDNGTGMTREELDHVFEPFFTTKDPDHGTGLGLWICHEVIRAHNGMIHIGSRKGQGATVTIRLPHESSRGVARADQPAPGGTTVAESSRP